MMENEKCLKSNYTIKDLIVKFTDENFLDNHLKLCIDCEKLKYENGTMYCELMSDNKL